MSQHEEPAAVGRDENSPRTRAQEVAARVRSQLREYPDFPRPGILFRDIVPLFRDQALLAEVVEVFAEQADAVGAQKIAGIESRGFLFAVPVCLRLGIPFIPVRKQGKLPGETVSAEYDLEYGKAHLEMQADAVRPGERIVIVDDLLATGGTAAATASLIEELGGIVGGIHVLVELSALPGRDAIRNYNVLSLLKL